MTKKILFLTKYERAGSTSRYRVYQYLPYLEQAGFEYTVEPLLSNKYLRMIYQGKYRWFQLLRQTSAIIKALFDRWWILLHKVPNYDVVYLEYEALPYCPFFLEKQEFRSTAQVVVDYDDAIYVTYQHHPSPLIRWLLSSKIPKIVEQSYEVIAGNSHLAKWATSINPNVTIIPTSVDLSKYPVSDHTFLNDKAVIGWIGTPITAKYLRLIEGPLRKLRSYHNFVLKVIGVPDFEMEGIETVGVPWSEESEVTQLRTCDIGIMPLPDAPWERGKSALKLIQYLAAGIPAVASPVGANCDVVEDGKNGLLAGTDEAWTEKMALLISDPAFGKHLAEDGRRTVELRYSVQANAPRWVEVLRRAANV